MKNKKLFFNRRANTLIYLIFTAVAFQGCLDDDETDLERQQRIDEEIITEYLESNNIEAERAPDGYYLIKTRENDAGRAVRDEDVVAIYYHMSLLNGNKVDSATATNGGPVKFGFDRNRITMVPSGLYIGISTMNEGEACRFIIPSYLAFGSYTNGRLIPANSIFIVDVELVELSNVDDQDAIEIDSIRSYIEAEELTDVEEFSSGLFYKQLEAGDGPRPRRGDNLRIHYKGTYLDGTVFDQTRANNPFRLTLGSTSVIPGFEEGIEEMQEGEKALLIMPSGLGYGGSFQVIPPQIREDLIDKDLISDSVIPYSSLIFEVDLEDIN